MQPMWECHNVYRYRNDILRSMGFKSYRSYLASALWKTIRQKVLIRPDGSPVLCFRCHLFATQVHHRAYDPATLKGESLESLTPVCKAHHRKGERPGKQVDAAERFVKANNIIFMNGKEKNRRNTRDHRPHHKKFRLQRYKYEPSVADASKLSPRLIKDA